MDYLLIWKGQTAACRIRLLNSLVKTSTSYSVRWQQTITCLCVNSSPVSVQLADSVNPMLLSALFVPSRFMKRCMACMAHHVFCSNVKLEMDVLIYMCSIEVSRCDTTFAPEEVQNLLNLPT